MKDYLFIAALFIGWIALNRWILPWFGIQTCMGGACARIPAPEIVKDRKITAPTDVIESRGIERRDMHNSETH
jgi:hypothetical protein